MGNRCLCASPLGAGGYLHPPAHGQRARLIHLHLPFHCTHLRLSQQDSCTKRCLFDLKMRKAQAPHHAHVTLVGLSPSRGIANQAGVYDLSLGKVYYVLVVVVFY